MCITYVHICNLELSFIQMYVHLHFHISSMHANFDIMAHYRNGKFLWGKPLTHRQSPGVRVSVFAKDTDTVWSTAACCKK